MKKQIITLACAFAAIGLFAAEANLLKNPDFKSGAKVGWNTTGITCKDGGAVAPLNIVSKSKKDYHCNLGQELKLKPGIYIFSGYYKAPRNVYIVVRNFDTKNKSKNIIQAWLDQKGFVKATEKAGWYKFNYKFTVPADTKKVGFYLEGWGTAKTQNFEVTGLFLKAAK